MIAVLLLLAAAQASRAQNQTPASGATSARPAAQSAAQAPNSTPVAAPDASPTPASPTHGQHAVTITFDYDFRLTPACSKKATKACVEMFVAYDISAGASHAAMLFPIPLPVNPVGAVHGITATSPKLEFESGRHLISVIALGPDGKQSRKSVCTTWIVIP
jgi:hypothetical protein